MFLLNQAPKLFLSVSYFRVGCSLQVTSQVKSAGAVSDNSPIRFVTSSESPKASLRMHDDTQFVSFSIVRSPVAVVRNANRRSLSVGAV